MFLLYNYTMRYVEKLFKNNEQKRESKLKFVLNGVSKKNFFTYHTTGETLTGELLHKLFEIANIFFKNHNKPMYVFSIHLHTLQSLDKNVYMFLDLLAYYIYKEGKFCFEVYYQPK